MTKTQCKYLANCCYIICILYILINVCLCICATGHITEVSEGSSPYYIYIGWAWSEVCWIAVGVITFCTILLMLPWLYASSDLKQSCKISALLPIGKSIGGILYTLLNLFLAAVIVIVLFEKATIDSRAIIDNCSGEILVYNSYSDIYLILVLLTIFPIYTIFTFITLPVRKELKGIVS